MTVAGGEVVATVFKKERTLISHNFRTVGDVGRENIRTSTYLNSSPFVQVNVSRQMVHESEEELMLH